MDRHFIFTALKLRFLSKCAGYTHALDQSATLVIGGLLETEKSWPLTVVPDRVPTIAFAGPIEVSNRAVMLFTSWMTTTAF